MGGRRRDAEAELNLPPGFRFHPTDEELVVHYLCRKVNYQCLPVPIIAEVDLYKCDPWQLPEKALFGQKEWYFFTPRERKYPNGSRPNRAAASGYWKATGADKPIRPKGSSRHVGIKKALVFYAGKAPKGIKTNWIMHEYRLADPSHHASKKGSLRLDEWVLCRLYNKKNNQEVVPKAKAEMSVETNEDLGSDCTRSPESNVENNSYTELDNLGRNDESQTFDSKQQVRLAAAAQSFQTGESYREDNNWFTDLNLEDLQSSVSMFGGLPMPDFMNQDHLFEGLHPPQLKPGQVNILTVLNSDQLA